MKITAVVGIVQHKDTILIGKKKTSKNHPMSNQWHIPGGKVEVNETPTQALRREIREETSIDITDIQEIQTTKHDTHIIQWYLCTAKNTSITASDDLINAQFVKRSEVKKYCSNESIRRWPQKVHEYFTRT